MFLVFTSSSSLLSRMIRKVTQSEVSHVALGLLLEGVPVFLHADVGGVQISPEKSFYAKRKKVYAFRLLEPVSPKLAVEYIGARYDYLSLAGHLLRSFSRWLGYSYRRPLQSPRALVCSEFIARLGLSSFVGLDPENTTPQDLLEVCKRAPELAITL